MATLGVMGVLIEEVAAEAKANAELEKQHGAAIEEAVANSRQVGITHHYKSTRTHSDTLEINAEDGASAKDKAKAEAKAGLEEKSHCGCFGRIFARKK